MDLSVVVPVYCSAATLPHLSKRLFLALETMAMHCEVVFVDDGSRDDSWKVLRDLQRAHPDRIVAVQLMRNFGQHNALMCGFRHSSGRYVATIDDDLQNGPEDIPILLGALQRRGLDVVYGKATAKKQRAWRNLGSALVNAFYRLTFNTSVAVSSFRVMRREVVQSILAYELNYTYVDGLLAWATQRIGDVEVEHHPRREGRSGYTFGKLSSLALNLFTNFSLLPLQAISLMGFAVSAAGLLASLYFLAHYLLSNITVPGYASTIIAILLLGGTQLLAIGIIGEYLGRLHLNVNRKPQYLEREVLAPARLATNPTPDGNNSDHPLHRKVGRLTLDEEDQAA